MARDCSDAGGNCLFSTILSAQGVGFLVIIDAVAGRRDSRVSRGTLWSYNESAPATPRGGLQIVPNPLEITAPAGPPQNLFFPGVQFTVQRCTLKGEGCSGRGFRRGRDREWRWGLRPRSRF